MAENGHSPSLAEQFEHFDVNDLELGEVLELEEACGKSLTEIDFGSARAMVTIVWLMRRRDNPEYTVEEAKRVKLAEFEGPPTKPASKARGKKRAAAGGRS